MILQIILIFFHKNDQKALVKIEAFAQNKPSYVSQF